MIEEIQKLAPEGQLELLAETEILGGRDVPVMNSWSMPDVTAKISESSAIRPSEQGGGNVNAADAGIGERGDDDNIITAFDAGLTGLVRVPSGGGAPTPVTKVNKEKFERHTWPQVLPGSQAVLFGSSLGSYDDASIEILSFKTGGRKTVLRGGFFGRYLATSNGAGHLVYMHQNTLFAAPFDLNRLAVTGTPQPILEDVSDVGSAGSASFDFSQSGTFVYISSTGESPWSIFWLDSAGNTEPLHLTPGFYWTPRVSPDGNRLVFAMGSPGGGADLWVNDLKRDTTSRLTSLPGWNSWPVWSPDSKNIVFNSRGPAAPGLYWIRADGSGEARRLTDGQEAPYSFFPDGTRLTYEQPSADGHTEIRTAPVGGDPDHPRLGKAEPFLGTQFSETTGAFSPDGRWLAYRSDETGAYEVYVRPFPGPGSKS